MADSKISALTAATALNDTDVFPIVQAGTTKKITKSTVVTELGATALGRWTLIAGENYEATPMAAYRTGAATFANIPDWTAGTAFTLGQYCKPTTENGYVYECVEAGTTHTTTEPTWGTTLGDDLTDGAVDSITWRCRGCHVIEMKTDLTGTVKNGMPLKIQFNSATYYAQVYDISATRLSIVGAPMFLNHDITALYYGTPEMVRQVNLFVSGAGYGATAQDLLLNKNNQYLTWQMAPAFLVMFKARHKTNDGTDNPEINVKIGGSLVSNNEWNAGSPYGITPVAAGWVENSPVAVNTSNYDIVYGAAIEVACTRVSGDDAAANLSVQLIFVEQ